MIPYTLAYYPVYAKTGKIDYHPAVPVSLRDDSLTPGGLDFVSLNYKVIVRASADSMLVFDSSLAHGTTPAVGVTNKGGCSTVSRATVVAFKEALKTRRVRGLPEGVSAGEVLVETSGVSGPGSYI